MERPSWMRVGPRVAWMRRISIGHLARKALLRLLLRWEALLRWVGLLLWEALLRGEALLLWKALLRWVGLLRWEALLRRVCSGRAKRWGSVTGCCVRHAVLEGIAGRPRAAWWCHRRRGHQLVKSRKVFGRWG